MARAMKVAVVCGDGVPASGLLTVLRSVIELGIDEGLVAPRVPADLGFSWRPDKPRFYPRPAGRSGYPRWLDLSQEAPAELPAGTFGRRLTSIRNDVARAATLSADNVTALSASIAALATPYEHYFDSWLSKNDADWLFAINMTLSDAPSVTSALHRAAKRRWEGGRRGGVVFWDHDLFRSCSVFEDGVRVYPAEPNELTLLPDACPWHRWLVASRELADEAAGYPTALAPVPIANLLPPWRGSRLEDCHLQFLDQQSLGSSRPIMLAPVRMFRPKGLDITLALAHRVREASRRRRWPEPFLLIFGSLDEDRQYATELRAQARRLDLLDSVRFLDGVPLGTYRDTAGSWHLDEIDLLRLAAATAGAVIFTPSQPDLESVGLGPALAAVAGLPCAITPYHAFARVYGPDFSVVQVDTDGPHDRAAGELLTLMRHPAPALDSNRAIVGERFPAGPWRSTLRELNAAVA
jgi:glycosyltransferase involved in cell wall biosynthesis